MCLDPHAVAKIEARELLDRVERLLRSMEATSAGVSDAEFNKIAKFRRRLAWCDECCSRRRSKLILLWVVKRIGELLLNVIETSSCNQTGPMVPRKQYDTWTSHQTTEGCRRLVTEGFRRAA